MTAALKIEVNDKGHVVLDDYANRLGLRVKEFSRATGISLPTCWRRIKAGDIRVIYIGDIPIISRAEQIRLGLIAA